MARADGIAVKNIDHVRVQGLYNAGGGAGVAVLFDNTSGGQLVSCVVTDTVVFDGCDGADVVGCTLDYSAGGGRSLMLSGCTDAVLRNNLFLNTESDTGLYVTGDAPDSDYNLWYPHDRAGEGSIRRAPTPSWSQASTGPRPTQAR